jgi:flagellar basal-body rod modification protein FlgD
MISGVNTNISGVTDYSDTSQTAASTEGTDTLGKDTFMKLLLAQLQNQDPLNPMDATQFSAQLAQFSSLEQLYNMNESMGTLIDAQDSSNRYQALDLIGKEIEAAGDVLSLGDAGTAAGSFAIGSDANCAAVITDANGNVIKTMDLGSLEAGDHTFKWDGTEQDGDKADQGLYGFEIIAEGAAGQAVTAETRIRGIVNRVNMDGDEPMLYVGSFSLPFSEITDITLAEE